VTRFGLRSLMTLCLILVASFCEPHRQLSAQEASQRPIRMQALPGQTRGALQLDKMDGRLI